MKIWKFTLLVVLVLLNYTVTKAQFDFVESKVTIGGYGEVHYNYENQNENISKTLDFHRFVLFVGYTFSEKWSLKSEVEIEHNFVSDGEGEIALEQAYIDYHYDDYLGFQAGVLLASSGLINENHEPTQYFGVERPNYSKYIIPSTWFGNGMSVYGKYSGFEYKFNFMEGLNGDKFSLNNALRGGRQKGFESDVSSMLYNLRVDYLSISGLKIGASAIYNDAFGDSVNTPITLLEIHADYRKNGFVLVGELGNVSYDNSNLEQSKGYYFDFGYDFSKLLKWEWKIIPFVRYSDYNTASVTRNGGDEEKKFHNSAWMIGLSIFPIDNIVLKADYSQNTVELNSEMTEYFNFGLGYRF